MSDFVSQFKEDDELVLLSKIKATKLISKLILRETIEIANLDTNPLYNSVNLVDGEIVFEEATSSFVDFDKFIAWISYYLEDQTIMLQSIVTGEVKAIEVYNGQAFKCDIVINVLPKELIEI